MLVKRRFLASWIGAGRWKWISFRQSLQPATPAVLPGHTNSIVIAGRASVDAGAGEKLQRVVAVDRQGSGQTCTGVTLPLTFHHAIDGPAPSGAVGAVHGQPYARRHILNEVGLQGIKRVLSQCIVAKNIYR